MNVPETVLVPYKNPIDNARWAYTSARYNKAFDLDAIADELGYPLFMKPFDGGGWRGVSQVKTGDDLHSAYDDSGEMLMHLQTSVTDFEVFARALTIGPETMVMKFRPERADAQPVCRGARLPRREGVGTEAVTIAQTVNAFFRWEFNSCEMLVKDGVVYPIDYANACPDVAVTSLHYYFPWAMKALLRWSVYCVATGRKAAHPGRHRAVVRGGRRRRRSTTRASSRPTRGWPTTTSRPSATGSSARRRCRTSTRWCWSGSTRPTSASLLHRRRSSRPTRRTSGSGSRATSAA